MTRKLTPDDAVERYLNERKPEVSESTLYNYTYLLERFADWCNTQGIDYINEIDGFTIHDFKLLRRDTDDISNLTLHKNMCTLRTFIRHMESWDVVDDGLADNMILPEIDSETRDRKISAEQAHEMLEYLDKYEYGTKRHALFAILWDTGMRLGSVRSLDHGDYHPEEKYIELHHRPESDTPLKNAEGGEREVNLHAWVCEVLDDYLQMNRHNVTDDYGRKPLFTTKHGRPARSGLRMHITALSRPCHHTGECPHDRDQMECEAWTDREYAARCPSSISPHDIRRSSITEWLKRGHRKEIVSDRCDVSPKVLDKHYDVRTKTEKRELRRDAFGMD
ncbi:site-specific integrase [Halorussus sp. MSC15.2]|uniref:tyrosine-type recombinase/integrase n=1 Tax=Halorussus sp. MSC15.2 TaxID=2283638 RepID=UPI0013D07594|nr:site-specific integrase [Halorussus sp. MSC15.2]NEU56286.1 site-specific integrase [Halorussus sp. MSC15.2]